LASCVPIPITFRSARAAVQTIAERVKPFEYDAIYGAFWNAVIPENGKHAIKASVARHVEWLAREIP
jgi:hypothetical protein